MIRALRRDRGRPAGWVPWLAVLALAYPAASGSARGQGLEDAPGTVVYHRPSPASFLGYGFPPNRVYTASPSIVVLPSGRLLIAFNLFGADTDPPASESGTTFLFRSGDAGATWTELPSSPLMDTKRGSLFVHDGDLYLYGYTTDSGDIIVRKSTDEGDSWTSPRSPSEGLLRTGTFGGTPFRPVAHEGRLWFAQGGKRVLSIPAGADLLDAGQWRMSRRANTNDGPLGPGLVVTEAQIVPSADGGVVLMPKVGGLPRTVLVRVPDPAAAEDPSPEDWVPLPGGGKKFAAGYDPASGRYFVLSNPVLPVHDGHPSVPPELIRNAAALLSSEDLASWDLLKLFLYSPNIGYEAFQYLDFDVDGDDLVVASRTAFDIGGNRPPRGHDSNMVTFHRIQDFRDAAPRHFLAVEGGRVARYEHTQHAPAPLGDFILGGGFEGVPLGPVDGVLDDGEAILVREESGRVLRFDLFGNFLQSVDAGRGLDFATALDPIPQPPQGQRAWTRSGSGDWADPANWHYWGRPDTPGESAFFGSAIASSSSVRLDRDYQVRAVRFDSVHSYALEGPGRVVLSPGDGRASIEAARGRHILGAALVLGDSASIRVDDYAALDIAAGVALEGHALGLDGGGEVGIGGAFAMGGGTLVLHGRSRLSFLDGAAVRLDGALEWHPSDGDLLEAGAAFRLIGNPTALDGAEFDTVALPPLRGELRWDLSHLYSDGRVAVVQAGREPGAASPPDME